MTVSLPFEQGLEDKILDSVVDLLTKKLQTEVHEDDASRLALIKVGPRQDDPDSVVILVHPNDPNEGSKWPHIPLRYQERGDNRLYLDPAVPRNMQLIGGGSRCEMRFTIEIEIWGDEITDIVPERRDVGQLASVLEGRIRKALLDAGPHINEDDIITSDFGGAVHMGPYWGEYWTDQPEGEAKIVRKYIRFYYICSEDWNTSAW